MNGRAIMRDIEDIRSSLDAGAERTGIVNSVIYADSPKGIGLRHNIKQIRATVGYLHLCKILLDSFYKGRNGGYVGQAYRLLWA